MSEALPLSWEIRQDNYLRQNERSGRKYLTAPQRRQLVRARRREELRDAGVLGCGANGVRTRRPLARAGSAR